MQPAGSRQSKRRIFLLLSSILVPSAVVIFLVVRLVHQETELSQRRAAEERRESLDQLRRELSARLQAIRVEEVNRLIGESGLQLPPDSPIVFVATLEQNRMVLPWEEEERPSSRTVTPLRFGSPGESLEFRDNDFPAAAMEYRRLLQNAKTTAEQCEARLGLGRAYYKAGMSAVATQTDRAMLQECDAVVDDDGVSLSLYAAHRLLLMMKSGAPGDAAAADHVIRKAGARGWRHPGEAYLLRSLLGATSTPAAEAALGRLSAEIHRMEQIAALSRDIHAYLEKLQGAFRSGPGDLSWVGYGDEPWLITVVSPASFATPVVMAVSSRKIAPAGVRLHAAPFADAMPLGIGFVDVAVEWPDSRFSSRPGAPLFLYGTILLLILGATFLAAYLLLRDLHREAQTAEMRSHFVASVSHELKTPLTAIQAVAETLLLDRAGPQAGREYLQTILSESARLTRLVENVLDFSRIERGRRTYRMQWTNLAEVVRSAAKAMEYPLSQFGFTVTVSTDDTVPMLKADADALKQALLNLIGNAMKYSGESRRISIRMGRDKEEAFVDVVDYGIGIAREDQGRIFDSFQRVRSADTEDIAGTGLGLALARHIVEAHRGRIELSSDVGRGSTFSVRIPLQEQA